MVGNLNRHPQWVSYNHNNLLSPFLRWVIHQRLFLVLVWDHPFDRYDHSPKDLRDTYRNGWDIPMVMPYGHTEHWRSNYYNDDNVVAYAAGPVVGWCSTTLLHHKDLPDKQIGLDNLVRLGRVHFHDNNFEWMVGRHRLPNEANSWPLPKEYGAPGVDPQRMLLPVLLRQHQSKMYDCYCLP